MRNFISSLSSRLRFRLNTQVLVLLSLWLLSSLTNAADNILIARPAGSDFEKIVIGIGDELEGELVFHDLVLDREFGVDDLYLAIKNQNPKALVLMGNRQLRLFKQMKASKPHEEFPPVVAVAALFIDRVMANVENVTGILYEIPAVTGLVSLRNISVGEIKRVGILYREDMADMIEINRQF